MAAEGKRQHTARAAAERRDLRITEQTGMPEPTGGNVYSSSGGVVPIQVFGAGYLLQSAAADHADKVVLFPFGDPFGTPICWSDSGLLQIWIEAEDLAEGRFDRVTATFERT